MTRNDRFENFYAYATSMLQQIKNSKCPANSCNKKFLYSFFFQTDVFEAKFSFSPENN